MKILHTNKLSDFAQNASEQYQLPDVPQFLMRYMLKESKKLKGTPFKDGKDFSCS